jgi:hypothetical protein
MPLRHRRASREGTARAWVVSRAGAVIAAMLLIGVVAGCQSSSAGPFALVIADVGPHLTNEDPVQGPSGRAISLAVADGGQRIYAGTWEAGLWRSRNAGVSWEQVVSSQTGDTGLKACDDPEAPHRLSVTSIAAVAVSPADPDLVFVGTANDREDCNGIYRSDDGGDTWTRVFHEDISACAGSPSAATGVQPVSEVVFAPDDPTKLWAASGCVIAYSTVGSDKPGDPPPTATVSSAEIGTSWNASATPLPNVQHLAVGPFRSSYDRGRGGRAVWACAPGSVIWSSVNGGQSFVPAPTGVSLDCANGDHALVADENDGKPVVYAIATSPVSQHALGLLPSQNYSPCPNCLEGVAAITRDDSGSSPTFAASTFGGPPRIPDAYGSGVHGLYGFTTGRALRVAPILILVFNNDEDFFIAAAPSQTGGSLAESSWHRLTGRDANDAPGCSISTGVCSGTTGDWTPQGGGVYLHDDAHAFAVTPATVVALGPARSLSTPLRTCIPTTSGSPTMVVANDGGVAVSPDCGKTWRYGDLPNVAAGELAGIARHGHLPALFFGGRDTGAFASFNGGLRWQPAVGGCGDCTGFYALDRHQTGDRGDPMTVATNFRFNLSGNGPQACCRWILWHSGGSTWPPVDNSRTADFDLTPYLNWPRMSTDVGWTPFIQPMPSKPVPQLPWLALIRASNVAPAPPNPVSTIYSNLSGWSVHRLELSLNGSGTTQLDRTIGAQLPVSFPVVQTSGGYEQTTYYVAGKPPTSSLSGNAFINQQTINVVRGEPPTYQWQCIVPSQPASAPGSACPTASTTATCPATAACYAYKLAVDPYGQTNRQRLYVADAAGKIKESLDSGATWFTNDSLTTWLTDQDRLANKPKCQWACAWADSDEELHHMLFVPEEPGTAFAIGVAGVFMTLNAGCYRTGTSTCSGEKWHRILDATATPCSPNSMFFDRDEPDGRALYVACSQRGVLKILGIPRPSDQARLDATNDPLHIMQRPIKSVTGFGSQPRKYQPSEPEDAQRPAEAASKIEGVVVGVKPNASP